MNQCSLEELRHKASRLKAVFFDVDGTLTDGTALFGPNGEISKSFSFRDGKGFELLRNVGLVVGIATGEDSHCVRARAAKLGLNPAYCFYGSHGQEKAERIRESLAPLGIGWKEVGYMGDDLGDLESLRAAGLSACPADAASEVRAISDYVSAQPGGRHAAREVCDFIVRAKRRGA